MERIFNKKEYKNKKWLEEKYSEEKMNQSQIAKRCGVSRTTICYYLTRLDIAHRPKGEIIHLAKCNHCNLSREAIEWLNGEMLGDGHLELCSLYSARFSYISKYLEYIIYVSDTLNSFGIKQSGEIIKKINKKYKNISYQYRSLYYSELFQLRERWYPKSKKIMPKDVKLIPLTCRQWYIGDGSLKYQINDKRPRIILYTCGFMILDVEWLIKQLKNLEFKVTRQSSNNIIHISVYSTKDFLDYIGKCPVKCYQYKWRYEK